MTPTSHAPEQADKELRERFTKFCGSLGYTGPATEETARGFDAVLAFVKEELSRAGGERTQAGHTAAEISAAVLTEARAKAREDGRDVEVTVLAMQLACAEVATLRSQLAAVEAARAKTNEGADKHFAQSEQSLREEAAALEKSNPGYGGRARDVLVELDRRAAVIESLRASLATAQDEAQELAKLLDSSLDARCGTKESAYEDVCSVLQDADFVPRDFIGKTEDLAVKIVNRIVEEEDEEPADLDRKRGAR